MTQAYQNMNERLLRYRNKMRQSMSKEGFILHERVLELEEKFMHEQSN